MEAAGRVGILPVDKPIGPTSHDVVAAARRALGIRRIGHTGTLDPFASGLLLLCLGPATRLAEYLTPLPKRYLAVMRLGVSTETDDRQGEAVFRSEQWRELDEHSIRHALSTQVGTRAQLPPLYSAKKVGGERSYRAARRGETVERSAVTVTIHRIDIREISLPDVEFEVECSAGTYIRAIARDVGESLNVGGHLQSLRRTGTGGYEVDHAISIEQLSELENVERSLVSPAAAVAHLPRIVVPTADIAAIAQGRSLAAPDDVPIESPLALLSTDGSLIAIAEASEGMLRPRKVFV